MLTRPVVLKPKKREPSSIDPVVRVESVRLTTGDAGPSLSALANGIGLRDWDGDGLKEHSAQRSRMWLTDFATNLALEFTLPELVKLSAIEIWNFNVPWETTNGVHKLDVAVSADGKNWQTVAENARIAEAEGTDDYDEPTLVQLEGVTAQKVRLQNIMPIGLGGKIGLSEVVFREQPGERALPLQPEDGARAVPANIVSLAWTPVTNASLYRVYLGTNATVLRLVCTTNAPRAGVQDLSRNTTYFWRVDTVPTAGRIIRGRTGKFTTAGLVACWQFDKLDGTNVADASGHGHTARVHGAPQIAEGHTGATNALEFDGFKTFAECPDTPAFDFGEGITIAFWAKLRQRNQPNVYLVAKPGGWSVAWRGDDGRLVFYLGGVTRTDGGACSLVSKRAIDDGEWHHVVGTYDGQKAELYIDGTLDSVAAARGVIGTSPEPVWIGKKMGRSRANFSGWIADVRIHSCGLTEQEVLALYGMAKR